MWYLNVNYFQSCFDIKKNSERFFLVYRISVSIALLLNCNKKCLSSTDTSPSHTVQLQLRFTLLQSSFRAHTHPHKFHVCRIATNSLVCFSVKIRVLGFYVPSNIGMVRPDVPLICISMFPCVMFAHIFLYVFAGIQVRSKLNLLSILESQV